MGHVPEHVPFMPGKYVRWTFVRPEGRRVGAPLGCPAIVPRVQSRGDKLRACQRQGVMAVLPAGRRFRGNDGIKVFTGRASLCTNCFCLTTPPAPAGIRAISEGRVELILHACASFGSFWLARGCRYTRVGTGGTLSRGCAGGGVRGPPQPPVHRHRGGPTLSDGRSVLSRCRGGRAGGKEEEGNRGRRSSPGAGVLGECVLFCSLPFPRPR